MPSLCSIGRQDEQTGNDSRAPAKALADDLRSQANLLVELAKGRLDRHQLCLDLDDEERARVPAPGHQVDGASLAILGVRHLGDDLPAPGRERSRDGANQRSMALIEQSGDDAAPPREVEPHGGVQGVEDHSQGSHGRASDLAALEGRDGRLAHACPRCQVALTPTATPAQEPDGAADRQIIHGGSIATVALPALIPDLPRTFAGDVCGVAVRGRGGVARGGVRGARRGCTVARRRGAARRGVAGAASAAGSAGSAGSAARGKRSRGHEDMPSAGFANWPRTGLAGVRVNEFRIARTMADLSS